MNEYERLLDMFLNLRIARSGPALNLDTWKAWKEWHRLGWTGWAGCELGLSLYTRFIQVSLATLSAGYYLCLIFLISIISFVWRLTVYGKMV